MGEILTIIGYIIYFVSYATYIVIRWVAVGVYLAVFYTFHPHPEYIDHLQSW